MEDGLLNTFSEADALNDGSARMGCKLTLETRPKSSAAEALLDDCDVHPSGNGRGLIGRGDMRGGLPPTRSFGLP
jgi:hypothetical protein